jgi:general secretion pathway protein J
MRSGRRQEGGFTLLELVVAIAIFAAMYVMAQQFLSAALRNRETIDRHADALETAQRTLIFLTMDLEQVVARPVRDRFGETRPMVEGDEETVSVTRLGWANPMDLRKRSTLQRVTWRLEGDQLIRSHYRVLDRGQSERPVDTVMMEDVTSFEVRYLFRNQAGEWQWNPRWPRDEARSVSPIRQPLPHSLEITVERTQGQGLHRYFRLVENPWS